MATNSFPGGQGSASSAGISSIPARDFNISNPNIGIVGGVNVERWGFNDDSPQPAMENIAFTADMNMGMGLDDNTFTWEMIGLGLEEPLPPQETIDELYVIYVLAILREMLMIYRHQIYFDKIHPSLPMIHKYRYLAAMNLSVLLSFMCCSRTRVGRPFSCLLLYLYILPYPSFNNIPLLLILPRLRFNHSFLLIFPSLKN